MRTAFFALAIFAAMGLVAAPAASARATTARVKKKAFIFKGDDVWGAVVRPDGTFITGAKQPIHESLIEYRLDFKPEMLKLTSDL